MFAAIRGTYFNSIDTQNEGRGSQTRDDEFQRKYQRECVVVSSLYPLRCTVGNVYTLEIPLRYSARK